MSEKARLWPEIRSSQVEHFGEYTPAARVKDAAGDEIEKALGTLPLNATGGQVAAVLDVLERDRPHLFRKFSEQDELIFTKSQKQETSASIFGVTKAELAKFNPAERLALANTDGKTLPTWLRISRQKGGRP